MKRYKINLTIFTFIITLMLPITALANSSWCWLTDVRPIYILPIVAVITIAAETGIIHYFGKVHKTGKVLTFVTLANLLSFLLPYLTFSLSSPYSFHQFIENTPSYTVTGVFLFITLIIEIPIVFFTLKKSSENKMALFISIAASNTITTLMVAIVERLVCKGVYF